MDDQLKLELINYLLSILEDCNMDTYALLIDDDENLNKYRSVLEQTSMLRYLEDNQ